MAALWLVRKTDNTVLGPYSQVEIKTYIHEKRLTLNDEICAGNGYWFALHEKEEIYRQLGIDMPALNRLSDEEEETQTDTKVLLQTGSIPELDFDALKGEDGQTRAISSKVFDEKSRSQTTSRPPPSAMAQNRLYKPVVFGQMERFSVLKLVGFALGGIVLGLLLTMMRRFI